MATPLARISALALLFFATATNAARETPCSRLSKWFASSTAAAAAAQLKKTDAEAQVVLELDANINKYICKLTLPYEVSVKDHPGQIIYRLMFSMNQQVNRDTAIAAAKQIATQYDVAKQEEIRKVYAAFCVTQPNLVGSSGQWPTPKDDSLYDYHLLNFWMIINQLEQLRRLPTVLSQMVAGYAENHQFAIHELHGLLSASKTRKCISGGNTRGFDHPWYIGDLTGLSKIPRIHSATEMGLPGNEGLVIPASEFTQPMEF